MLNSGAVLNHLESTRTGASTSVDYKELTRCLSLLEATLTKKEGGGSSRLPRSGTGLSLASQATVVILAAGDRRVGPLAATGWRKLDSFW